MTGAILPTKEALPPMTTLGNVVNMGLISTVGVIKKNKNAWAIPGINVRGGGYHYYIAQTPTAPPKERQPTPKEQ